MNHFGRLFQVNIFGASHAEMLGVLVDGVKPGISLSNDDFSVDLERRRANKVGSTSRLESDKIHIMSGVFNGFTTGQPILLEFSNDNVNSKVYSQDPFIPRPSHADLVAKEKFNGFNDYRGGGSFSGRLTVGLVAAGVIAKKMLPCSINSELINLNGITDKDKFDEIIKNTAADGDSVGGIVEIKVSNLEIGVGEPYFDSIESVLSHLLFSVGGVKGVEFGIGFDGIKMKGSEFNDCYIDEFGHTKTNNNGGINGGISNGNDIVIKVFVKPTPSIFKAQKTFNFTENKIDDYAIEGRHDAAIVKRIDVILEACVAIGLADLYLVKKAYSK